MAFINGEAERAFFLVVEVVYLFLHGLKHLQPGACRLQAKDGIQKIIELPDANGGEADVFHVVEVDTDEKKKLNLCLKIKFSNSLRGQYALFAREEHVFSRNTKNSIDCHLVTFSKSLS